MAKKAAPKAAGTPAPAAGDKPASRAKAATSWRFYKPARP